MRDLTQQEQNEVARLRANFESVVGERMPVLANFAEGLDLAEPLTIVADPQRYVTEVGDFMRDQIIDEDDRAWITTRLAYLIGEVLVQRLAGRWLLNEIPDSRYFARYVVSDFLRVKNPTAMVDPFEAANMFVSQSPPRDLVALLARLDEELRSL